MMSELSTSDASIGLALAQQFADRLGARLGIGALAARGGELRVEVAELLVRQRRIVGADQQIRLGAKRLDPPFGFRDLGAQLFDFTGQPLAGAARLLLLGVPLAGDIGLGDGIGDAAPRVRHPPTGTR